MNRSLLALALGAAALSVVPLASAEAPKKKDRKQAETRLSKLEDQVESLKKQQAVDTKQIRTELADIAATLKKLKGDSDHGKKIPVEPKPDPKKGQDSKPQPKKPDGHHKDGSNSGKCSDQPGTGGGSDSNKPVEELPIPGGAELSVQAAATTTVTGKRYFYIPLSSLSAGAVVSSQSLSLAAAPALNASAIVTQPITTFATPAASTCSSALSTQAFTPHLISAYSTPVTTGYSVPYQASGYAMPYQGASYGSPYGYDSSALATNYLVNSLPNFQTLQIRGGRTFVTAPSATRPYVLSPYEASYYGVAGTQSATVFSQGMAIPPSVAPRSVIRTWR